MKTLTGKFTFVVPEGHAQEGTKIEGSFDYPEVETDAEALTVIADKVTKAKTDKTKASWSVKALVNEALKSNARSNAYQAASLPYRPSEVPEEDIVERMVRDYIRLGVPEDAARKQVAALREAAKSDDSSDAAPSTE